MSSSTHVLPSAFPHSSSRHMREHEPFTLDDLARALRGMPRNAEFWVEAATGLCPIVGIAPTHVRTVEGGLKASTVGTYGIVLRLGPMPALQPRSSTAEDRYRAVLQAIARGRSNSGTAVSRVEAQQLAREALVDMGDDWTKRGTRDRI